MKYNITERIIVMALISILLLLLLPAILKDNDEYNASKLPESTQARSVDIELFIDALEVKESNRDTAAIGDGGRAVGILQIWKIMVDDVNRILGYDHYLYSDRLSRQKSREMCKIYLHHYCGAMSWHDMARCWNSGPTGYKKECSIGYANDVIDIMEEL